MFRRVRRLAATLVSGAALTAAVAVPAAAQTPATSPSPATLALSVTSGLRFQHTSWVLQRDAVTLRGVLRPAVAGQTVTLNLIHFGHRVKSLTVRVGPRGVWTARVRAAKTGTYTIRAAHPATSAQAAATARPQRFTVVSGSSARQNVGLLQFALGRLGYITSHSGRIDPYTSDGILAFRKVNGLSRTSDPDYGVFERLLRGQGGFRLRYPRAGRHVEFSWTRQVVVLADHGRPQAVYPASSGKPSTPTVFGTFHFYRKDPGTNSEGMYDSNYFIGGYAIHGYPDVPTYPASHGCIRVPNWEAPGIFASIKIGETIFVYH